jgi:hypothetical protein
VRALRAELAASRGTSPPTAPPTAPPITERIEVVEQRVADQAQTKVEASQKLPITLTGMVLFNAWMNGRATGGAEFPTTASHQQLLGRRRDGQPERAGYEIPGARSFGRGPA